MTDDRSSSEPGDDEQDADLPPPVFPPVDEPSTAPPPSPPVPPAGTGGMYPEASQATLALVLGILSIVFCQILGPFAWWMGNKELEAIDAGRRPPENRSNANAGRITGIVGTVLLGLGLLALAAFVVFWLFIAVGANI